MSIFENLPNFNEELSNSHLKFLETFTKACRRDIVEMVSNAQSGHPGGSLSTIDYLATLYTFVIGKSGEKVVISHGHTSPSTYACLAEMGYIPRDEVVRDFRKAGSIYEGHITRHVRGINYGTGPLGIGVSVGAAMALAKKLKNEDEKVYALMGDGEVQEGQVHEMIHFAKHHKLNNLILFVDYNKVQLTSSLKEIQDIDIHKTFEAGDWEVIEIDGHDYEDIWQGLSKAQKAEKPVVIIGNTIMGSKGGFLEEDGKKHIPTWHGKSPSKEEAEKIVNSLSLSPEEENLILEFRKNFIEFCPKENEYPKKLSKIDLDTGKPNILEEGTKTDCRSAYGKALLDLAQKNKNIVALTADLKGSVKTDGVSKELPKQYIECGIAEQNMVSLAGGLSFENFIPFASTFGAFMTSRAKDQARVNDINYTNVKMVATHCGLSVGEDGPTHQAIDDMGSFLGFFNTMIIEPADANQTDHIIRYIASHFGNFYVRMGRHKFEVLTKEDGSPFFDENYKYEYGKCDKIREGKDITVLTSGALSQEALLARKELQKEGIELEIITISSLQNFDQTVLDSIKKTKKIITAEDHNPNNGLASQLARFLLKEKLEVEKVENIAVREYQLSGTQEELYKIAKIDSRAIIEKAKKMM